jgi:hypothetical protein
MNSTTVIVQYLGFQVKALSREYTFQVREAGAEREFTVAIPNEAFLARLVSYQDAPNICSKRLQAELEAHANHPPDLQFVITSEELETFRASRASDKPKRWSPPQPPPTPSDI